MTNKQLRVAATQLCHAPGDKAGNLARMREIVRQASQAKVELLCFPECCVSGYWHLRKLSHQELRELAEPIPGGGTSEQLSNWSRQFNITIGAGLLEWDGESLYNAYLVAAPDGQLWRHRKLHCFVSEHMESGDEFTVFDMPNGWRAAILICYDNNIVENVRTCALRGAEIILAPHQTGGCNSGSPFAMGVIERKLWDDRQSNPGAIEAELRGDKGRGWLMRWLPARAHDNGVFYVFSNGIGPDDDEVRTGNAMLLDPYGRILAETWAAGDDMVIADFDGSLRERCTGVRWMRARRPELYHDLVAPRDDIRDTRSVRFDHVREPTQD
jgi:predicted amidohydrolase